MVSRVEEIDDARESRDGMEYWDAVDVRGELLGKRIIRDQPIPEGWYHHVVEILVATPDGHVFVTQRAPNKTFPLKWEITGGSVLAGERVLQGAVRELWEETGLDIEEADLTYLNTLIGDNYLFHSYLTVIDVDGSLVRMQDGETVDWRLLSWDEFFAWIKDGKVAQTIGERMEFYLDRLKGLLESKNIPNFATAFKNHFAK